MNTDLQDGQILDGRFKISGLISHGGMASIYEAVDSTSDGKVAIKLPFGRNALDPVYSSRFEREETIGRSLDHPSVVRILPMEPKSRPYIVMERLEGELLSQILREGEPVETGRALRIAAGIAGALEYMHARGVIHRDLKPSNIMLCKEGSIRVFDLGLARNVGTPDPRPLGFSQPLGTPDYMPPEQVLGKDGDERSDIYSLGAILYEMLTGFVPFPGADLSTSMNARVSGDPAAPRSLNPALSPELEELVLHAMERDPSNRYSSMKELLQDLQAPGKVIVSGRAERLKAPSPWVMRWRQARDFVWTFLVFLAVIALVVLVAAKWGRPHAWTR
jgi:serine/threonine-protein kinase